MRAVRTGAQVLGELLVTAGVLVLLFVAWQLWWTDVTSNREQAATTATLERQFGTAGPTTAKPGTGSAVIPALGTPRPGQAFALVRIPRFGRDYVRPVLQGTGYSVLQRGLGHYVGTTAPGQVGNFALAGHRTTYGKPLNLIATLRPGDVVVVETRVAYDVYAVTGHVIVAPTRVDVLDAVPQHPGQPSKVARLTLTSCHPEYSARQRYVVFGQLRVAIPRREGLPAAYLAVPKGVG